jgi:Lrp/AsnC family transcriptional regulator for asnA, asnC and gidA
MSQVDEKDVKIIQMLEEDGRKSYDEMAGKLGMSEAGVRKRVQALMTKGVIKFTVKVDHAKIGMNTVAIVGVDVDPSKMLEIAQNLCELVEVKCVATSSGDHMMMTEIWTHDGQELRRLISNRIETMEGVRRICPALLLEKLKDQS